MKKPIMFALLLGPLMANVAHADTMKGLVRISCVPVIGLLDIEFRELHDSVAADPTDPQSNKMCGADPEVYLIRRKLQ